MRNWKSGSTFLAHASMCVSVLLNKSQRQPPPPPLLQLFFLPAAQRARGDICIWCANALTIAARRSVTTTARRAELFFPAAAFYSIPMPTITCTPLARFITELWANLVLFFNI